MKATEITVKCVGSQLQAFLECLKICKAINDKINLEFSDFTITVYPDSNIKYLMEIHRLKTKSQLTPDKSKNK